ncbi:type II toxin-antitoxin system RelE/ParE family toxin [Roseivivax sp. GX 12232]|uniref:type II toxin-antitoxin system RelE/ParE family toxin n=1 Tax=Roseivivax sp. GX 12232 TaxID=2900547 RepID=UPI001E4142B8|nr:type II toxin-antitoxin system RelE/ParE family toxin [Roseivivax sp. GX 12232]MCE0505223.1 type II toxin-antitoxin system RelE/ParE family toxin [Roseivivax sp. GX 12232]
MQDGKRLVAAFFRTERGGEPVRDWLKSLPVEDHKQMGGAIMAAEYGWPIGLPTCRPLSGHAGLWEVRAALSDGRIGRVIFTLAGGRMVLLHGFVKKSQKTPRRDIALARTRQRTLA